MDRTLATTLIRDTFESPFQKERFRHFAKNLLNKVDESKAFHAHGYVPETFKEFVRTYERLGTYTDPEENKVDILIVYLQKETSLERARTAQRNFAAHYLKDRDQKEAGLVAFVSPDPADWRFSLVKMDYHWEGGTKVKTELTPARRWSFLVGENESSHTAQSWLMPILLDDEQNPSLQHLEEAFNIEKVTREFFEKYRELFYDVNEALEKLVGSNEVIRNDFTAKEVNTIDFSKKLLGQIVFLYFLQKKGWFGVARDKDWGTGPRNFLRLLFEKNISDYHNFFNDVLEPLFYEALATERTEDFYSRFNCKIPFLNGGLFDPINGYDWVHADILLPDELFSNTRKTREGDTGTGILDVFDRYNFTVKEDEPLEKEVAIDPEMLGKVFENLLEVKDRKSRGTYYTPREIVHYMCQESLINYLDTVINTNEVPVVATSPPQGKLFGKPDPEQATLKTAEYRATVPREDIEDFIRFGDLTVENEKTALAKQEQIQEGTIKESTYKIFKPSVRDNARLIDDNLSTIRVCDPAIGSGAFPVGMMTEIVRARKVLNAYLNEEKHRTSYHFKRHAIQNCLYGVDIDAGAVEIAKLRLWLSLVVDEEDIKQIQPLPNLDYKIVCGNSLLGIERRLENYQLLDQLEKLKPLYFDETNARKKHDYKSQIDSLIMQITNNKQEFDFKIYFSEVFHEKGGFDVVIANPPYVRQEQIKELKSELKKYFECYDGTSDIYVYFYERGKQILKKNGTLTYISSNKYFRAGYGEKLRRFLSNNCQICQIIDFGDAPVFEAISYPSIIVLKNNLPQVNNVHIFTWKPGPPLEEFASIVHSSSSALPQNELTADGWRLESTSVLRLMEKLRQSGKPLGEYVNRRFYRGILTGLNEAFVVDRATRDRLITEHQSSAELLKPFLRGKDVKRWKVNFAEQYLIKIESSENRQYPWSGKKVKEAEKIFAKTYPSIHNWFEPYRKELIKRQDQGEYFWELRSCKYWREFEQPKVILGRFMNEATFTFDSRSYFHNDALYMIAGVNEYVVGVLNSSVCWWFLTHICTDLQNGYLQAFRENLFQIPIPVTNANNQVRIVKLISEIMANEIDSSVVISDFEHQIDQMVYHLYGLTPEEIAIIEGAIKK